MENIESIRSKIKVLYETNPHVHLSIFVKHPKLQLNDVSVTITGIYNNLFRVELDESSPPKGYTLQYTDVYIKTIRIAELEALQRD